MKMVDLKTSQNREQGDRLSPAPKITFLTPFLNADYTPTSYDYTLQAQLSKAYLSVTMKQQFY